MKGQKPRSQAPDIIAEQIGSVFMTLLPHGELWLVYYFPLVLGDIFLGTEK